MAPCASGDSDFGVLWHGLAVCLEEVLGLSKGGARCLRKAHVKGASGALRGVGSYQGRACDARRRRLAAQWRWDNDAAAGGPGSLGVLE